ncbi:MAG TPA: AAA family ATPase [Gemmatimonadaceae bacterium]
MIHLRSLALPAGNRGSGFPFSVPAISTLTEIEFTTPVTFLVGENGSGKPTLLEHVRLTREFLADPDRFLRRL